LALPEWCSWCQQNPGNFSGLPSHMNGSTMNMQFHLVMLWTIPPYSLIILTYNHFWCFANFTPSHSTQHLIPSASSLFSCVTISNPTQSCNTSLVSLIPLNHTSPMLGNIGSTLLSHNHLQAWRNYPATLALIANRPFWKRTLCLWQLSFHHSMHSSTWVNQHNPIHNWNSLFVKLHFVIQSSWPLHPSPSYSQLTKPTGSLREAQF